MAYHMEQELGNLRIADHPETGVYFIGVTTAGVRRVPAGAVGSGRRCITVLDSPAIAKASTTPPVVLPSPGAGKWNELVSINTQVEPGSNPLTVVVSAMPRYEGDDSSIVDTGVPLSSGPDSMVATSVVHSWDKNRQDVEDKAIVLATDVAVSDSADTLRVRTSLCTVTVVYIEHTFATPTPPPTEARSKKRK